RVANGEACPLRVARRRARPVRLLPRHLRAHDARTRRSAGTHPQGHTVGEFLRRRESPRGGARLARLAVSTGGVRGLFARDQERKNDRLAFAAGQSRCPFLVGKIACLLRRLLGLRRRGVVDRGGCEKKDRCPLTGRALLPALYPPPAPAAVSPPLSPPRTLL